MMRGASCLWMVACLALAGQARAVDLTTVDRSLRKEPAYESKNPPYCLLVFGPEATTRVWVVLDGDVLYLDRNGNGDLTDPGERIAAREVYRNLHERPDVEVMRTFELACFKPGASPILTCGPEVRWFYVNQLVPREDWHDVDWVRHFQDKPFDVAVNTRLGRGQRAGLRFAPSRDDAPIVHFDGPRRVALSDKFGPHLFRRGEPTYLAVELRAPGFRATARTEIYEVPETVHPVAEIEFPPGKPGGEPIRVHIQLKERC